MSRHRKYNIFRCNILLFEEKFKTELLAFLSQEDVDLLEKDVVSIINKFPLDVPKKKNYLNILINIFLRYRTQSSDINDIVKMPLLEIGSNPKEITLRQNKTKINFLEFKNIIQYFSQSDLTNLEKYFHAINIHVADNIGTIEFSKNSLEQRVSKSINDIKEKVFDIDGIFYHYIRVSLEPDKNDLSFPEKKDNDEVLDLIDNMIRFYAWSRSSLAWNAYVSNDREIDSISDHYQALQWFLDGYLKRSTPFNAYSPKRYSQYIEALKSRDFKQYNKRINDVFTFTQSLILQIKNIYSLLNNSPFAVQKENRSNLFEIFKKVIGLQFSQEDRSSYSVEGISDHFKTLKTIFIDLGLSTEEFYDLNSSNIINSLLILIVKQIQNKELPVEFPFSLIWESKNRELVEKFIKDYSLTLDGTDHQMFEFLVEYIHGGVTKENFSSYFMKMKNIMKIQKQLLERGDTSDYDVVKFEDSDYLSSKTESYDFMDFKKLNDIENNIRQSLNNLKRLWVHDICGDPIFMNDPAFKKNFPLTLGKEKIEYVSELEDYLNKWNTYKENSMAIKKIQENIKIVSTIKLKLEGEQLVSGDYPGAISLIKAQKLIARENNRLLLKLKDLILAVTKFKYNEHFSNIIDAKILNSSDDALLSQSINIIDKIGSLSEEISSIDIIGFSSELKIFSDYIKKLLGGESRISQLKKFSETLEIRFNKLKSDTVVINTGLHLTNLNDSITNIISILKETNEILQKFYANSFNKDIFDQMNIIATTHNLEAILLSIKQINEQLESVVSNLSATFSEVSTYFDVFADISFQMMQKYGRLVSKNDFFSRLDNSRINFYEDQGSVVISDEINENASILEKQLFMEKTFALYTHLSRACGQINFALSKSFNNLVLFEPNKIEKIDRNLDVAKKVSIMTKNVDNYYKFLDSIRFPSRKYIQSLKLSLKNVVEVIAPVKASNKLIVEISNSNKLINALSKSKGPINYGLLRKLNDSLNRILKFIDSSVLDYFKEITDEAKKKEIITSISADTLSTSYSKKLNNKINNVRKLVLVRREELLTKPIETLLSQQPDLILEKTSSVKKSEKIQVEAETNAEKEAEKLVEQVAGAVLEQKVEEMVEEAAEAVIEEAFEEIAETKVVQELAEKKIEEVTESVIEEAVEEAVEEVSELLADETVTDSIEEVAENIVEEAIAEEVVENIKEETITEEIAETVAEEIADTIVEEVAEEIAESEEVQEEPESNQLAENESEVMDLEDSYEPEQAQNDEDNTESDDLITEMEKLLNVDKDKKEKKP